MGGSSFGGRTSGRQPAEPSFPAMVIGQRLRSRRRNSATASASVAASKSGHGRGVNQSSA